jgi:3-phosphoshikimate 1-carboxyvinyltransferase
VSDHNDHRIAMAFGILSLKYPNIKIDNPDVVSKSFPKFWEQLKLIRKAAGLPAQSPA